MQCTAAKALAALERSHTLRTAIHRGPLGTQQPRKYWRPHLPRLLGLRSAAQAARQQQEQAPSAEEKARLAAVLDRAQQLEYSGQEGQALELLRQELSQAGPSWGRGVRMLRQRLVHLRYSAGDYPGALREARALHDETCKEAGEGSGEALLFGLRLGILEAAAGEIEAGRQLIYRAGAWAAPHLQRMVQQQQEEGGQGSPLPDAALRRLSELVNEANFFGSVFAIKHLAQQGKVDEVLAKWEGLDSGVVHCFSYLLLSLPPGTRSMSNALREHDRLVAEWGSHPVIGERLQQQSVQLHGTARRVAEARP